MPLIMITANLPVNYWVMPIFDEMQFVSKNWQDGFFSFSVYLLYICMRFISMILKEKARSQKYFINLIFYGRDFPIGL